MLSMLKLAENSSFFSFVRMKSVFVSDCATRQNNKAAEADKPPAPTDSHNIGFASVVDELL